MMLFQDIPDGVKLRGRDFTKITEAHNADRVISVQGATTFPGSNGTALVIPKQKATRFRPTRAPWFLTGKIETVGGSPVAKIYINPGLVNNFIPVIGEVEIDSLDVPSITVTGASGIILLKATTTTGLVVTKVELINSAAVPVDTETTFHKTVGTWESASSIFTKVTSILNTNQTLYFCRKQPIWE